MIVHRRIWIVVAAAVVLALATVVYRAQNGTSGDVDQRIEALLDALEDDPRARLHDTRTLVEEVAEWARTGQVERAETYYALGVLQHYGEGMEQAAERSFRKAISLDPEWSWGYNALGVVLFDRDRNAAVNAFDRAKELAPNRSRPYVDLTILYRKAGEMDKAQREAETALEVDPDDAAAHNNYGVLLDVMGRNEEAAEYYRKAFVLDSKLPAALYNLACSYARNKDAKSAAQYLKQAIELDDVFRAGARDDPDFNPVRNDPAIKALLQPSTR